MAFKKTAACLLRNADRDFLTLTCTLLTDPPHTTSETNCLQHLPPAAVVRRKIIHSFMVQVVWLTVIKTCTMQAPLTHTHYRIHIYTAWVYTVVNYFLLIHSYIAIAVITTHRHTVITYIHLQQLSARLIPLTPSLHII